MIQVTTNDLPKLNSGGNKGKVDWKNSIGHRVHFIYDDIEGDLEIVKYIPKEQKLIIKYNKKPNLKIKTSSFLKGLFKNYISPNVEYKIGELIKTKTGTIQILDISTDGKGNIYNYKCNKCGWDKGFITKGHLKEGKGCSCCYGRTVVEGINDIPTTTPWMVKYFQGGYDEAKLYTKCSSKKIYPICPDCGRVKNKSMNICDIFRRKSINCICGDRISYSEKLMFNLLEQLEKQDQIKDFIYQYTSKNSIWCGKYKYDFYFEINNENYIIETHGLQHYEDSMKKWESLYESQRNDKLKRELALSNGIKEENYIVIDCRYSELEFIKNNILHSKLNKLFDLSKIDWIKCKTFIYSNLIKNACDLWNNNIKNTKEISIIMHLCQATIIKYLKIGKKLKWCDYVSRIKKD